MKWIGQHIWDFISRFRNDVYMEDLAEVEHEFSVMVGPDGKLTKSTHPGERSRLQVRNDEGATIPAGAPLYSKGEIGGSERILVGICDSSDTAKMPCIGVAEAEMNTTDTKDNFAITQGVYNTNISGFTGLSVGDTLYVNGGSAPHLTQTKPTDGSLIQNVGIVLKTNGTICQGLLVSAIGRTNDVPWPLYVDHANQRVGVGTSSPQELLHIDNPTGASSILLEGAAGYNSQILFRTNPASAGGWLNYDYSANVMTFGTNASEKMRLTSDGKLGISETNPEGLLHVYNPNDSGTTRTSVFEHRYGVNSLSQYARYGIIVKSADVTPSLGITNQTYNSVIQSFLYASPFTAKDIALQTLGGSVLVGLNATSGATHAKLVVKTDGSLNAQSWYSNNNLRAYINASGDFYSNRFRAMAGSQSYPPISFDSANKWGFWYSSGLNIITNQNIAATFTSAGRLGIGTTSPASKLDVRGTVQVGVDDTGYDVTFYGDTSGEYLQWDASDDSLEFRDNVKAKFGNSGDFHILRNATDSYLENSFGHIFINNFANDKDIRLATDDGTGGITNYIVLDGSQATVNVYKTLLIGTTTNTGAYKIDVAGKQRVQDTLELDDVLMLNAISTPSDPAAGKSVIYMDSSDGGIKCKINVGGTVVTRTLASFE